MKHEAMKTAVRAFELKVIDENARTFTGLAAAFSLDQGGDVILPGAFKRTLKDWKASKGKVIPLIDSHQRFNIRSVLGKMIDATETSEGLETTFQIIEGPDGDEVHRRLKGGYVTGLSIGYEPIEVRLPSPEEERTGVLRYLKQVKLREVSVVVFPMNEEARIDVDSVKDLLAATEGRDLTADEQEQVKVMAPSIRALLEKLPAEEKLTPAPADTALAPEDPRRIRMEAELRDLTVRSLGTGR